jgi:hypothetical protein
LDYCASGQLTLIFSFADTYCCGKLGGMKDEAKFMAELRVNDDKLSKEMYEKILDPTSMLNILIKKLQLYNKIESSLNGPVNKLIIRSLKTGAENQMMNTQLKRDMDDQIAQINGRIDVLQKKINGLYDSDV